MLLGDHMIIDIYSHNTEASCVAVYFFDKRAGMKRLKTATDAPRRLASFMTKLRISMITVDHTQDNSGDRSGTVLCAPREHEIC